MTFSTFYLAGMLGQVLLNATAIFSVCFQGLSNNNLLLSKLNTWLIGFVLGKSLRQSTAFHFPFLIIFFYTKKTHYVIWHYCSAMLRQRQQSAIIEIFDSTVISSMRSFLKRNSMSWFNTNSMSVLSLHHFFKHLFSNNRNPGLHVCMSVCAFTLEKSFFSQEMQGKMLHSACPSQISLFYMVHFPVFPPAHTHTHTGSFLSHSSFTPQ